MPSPATSRRCHALAPGRIARILTGVVLSVCLAACGGGGSPIGPSNTLPAINGPRILLAGQAGAYFLATYMRDVVTDVNIDGNVDYWLSQSPAFAALARNQQITAFVWYQGVGDAGRLTTDEYAAKLRQVISMVRVTHPGLPVRIVEIANFPIRAAIREAQRQVAADPGVQLIPTADLPLDPTNHLFQAGYEEVRDRIYRSLGR